MDAKNVKERVAVLLDHGADVNQIIPALNDLEIIDSLDALLSHGADISFIEQKIGRKLTEDELKVISAP